MSKVSIRNIINILLIFFGTVFFLYAYSLSTFPGIDYGYLKNEELLVINFLMISIIGFASFIMFRHSQSFYRGRRMGAQLAFRYIITSALKILLILGIAYGFLYFSIHF